MKEMINKFEEQSYLKTRKKSHTYSHVKILFVCFPFALHLLVSLRIGGRGGFTHGGKVRSASRGAGRPHRPPPPLCTRHCWKACFVFLALYRFKPVGTDQKQCCGAPTFLVSSGTGSESPRSRNLAPTNLDRHRLQAKKGRLRHRNTDKKLNKNISQIKIKYGISTR